jgi:hypothetical protein
LLLFGLLDMRHSLSSRRAGAALLLLGGLLAAVWTRAAGPEGKPSPPAPATIDFIAQIAPLLLKRCVTCHGGDKSKGGLRLDTAAHASKGGYSGAVIRPGHSDESRLIRLVTGAEGDDNRMPPKGEPLTAQEVGLLRAWIDQGAKWPDGAKIVVEKKPDRSDLYKTHWSFQPIRRPAVPEVKRKDWPINAIDRFILHRLETEGVEPAPPADRATLLRRVTLDLIGLPPTPEELAAFLKDDRPDAYERVVDRLLASSHYGEKWARPWLDLCHYADTDGYLTDTIRPVAWRYRQWLVDSLNHDLPYDQFTIEQLAGDLLPNATTDQRIAVGFLRNTLSNREGGADVEEFRVEQIVDRTMLTGSIWLGLTVGCARCHDHKYDPVSQKEFYQLYAFFDSADEINFDAPLPGEMDAERQKARQFIQTRRAALLAPLEKDIDELQRRWEKRLLEVARDPGKDYYWDRIYELLCLEWGGTEGEGQLEGKTILHLDPAKRTPDQKERLRDFFLRRFSSYVNPARYQELKLNELNVRLAVVDYEAKNARITRAPSMCETPIPRSVHLHLRGDFRTRGIEVHQGTPAFLPRLQEKGPLNRLTLARWLVAPENPLTSRVAVNRLWQEHFGRGLVLSSEDFGTQGTKPTHPELLDWLAAEFREKGWSQKAIHRLIVTSATYRQSSRHRPELQTRDPQNLWLARMSSLRLPGEQVRDTTLAASGLLNRTVGGPCVFPPQPDSVTKEGFNSFWTPSAGADRYRRGLYTFQIRLTPFAQNQTFDAPFPNRSCSRRERSNTPLQALTLLNDPVFVEAAQALAERLLTEKHKTAEERLERAYLLCLSRPPSPREKARLLEYMQTQRSILARDPKAVESIAPRHLPDVEPIEMAVWTGVSSVLLNLHEFITRD